MVMDPPYDKASRVEMIWQSDLRQRYSMRCARMEAPAYGVIRVSLRLKLLSWPRSGLAHFLACDYPTQKEFVRIGFNTEQSANPNRLVRFDIKVLKYLH